MPYIKQTARDLLTLPYEPDSPITYGELNYVITKLCLSFKPESYDQYNALIGVLECAKLELYRRAVAPYEDRKCMENGDVYPQQDPITNRSSTEKASTNSIGSDGLLPSSLGRYCDCIPPR